tara:strand:+ start:837 stop:1715 length:879 start_codon:yes stop_codon:yes gene_type:complete
MKIFLNASEISAMIGKNKFKQPSEVIFRIWQKYFYDDFNNTVKNLDKKSIKVIPKETDTESVKRIIKETKIDVKKELKDCLKSENINDMHKKKQEIIKKLPTNISKEQKNEFKKSLENMTNTNFGTRNENSIFIKYKEKTGNNAILTNEFYKRKIYEYAYDGNNIEWYLLGKVDGLILNEENESENRIIEIKNRMYRYFYQLREYEKIQTYSYMYILNHRKAHLVEALKNKDCDINIIDIEFDDEYWEYMYSCIEDFIKYFMNVFINSNELKELIIIDEDLFNNTQNPSIQV